MNKGKAVIGRFSFFLFFRKYLLLVAFLLGICVSLESNHYQPWTAFHNELLAFLAFIFLLFGETAQPKKISWLILFWCIAFVSIALQAMLGLYHFMSDILMAMIYLLSAFFAYQIGLSSGDRSKVLEYLALLFLFSGLASVMIALYQYFGFSSLWTVAIQVGERAKANLAQSNNFASMTMLALIGLVYLHWLKKFSVFGYLFIGGFLALGLCIAESRTILVQLIFVVVWFGFYFKQRILRHAYLVLPWLFYICINFVYADFKNAIFFMAEDEGLRLVEGNTSVRLSLFKFIFGLVGEFNWLGYGWGQVSIAQYLNISEQASRIVPVTYSHNILADVILWAGSLFGGVICLIFCFWFLRLVFSVKTFEAWFCVACLGVIGVHAMLELPLAYAYFLLPFFLLLGVVDNEQGRALNLNAGGAIYSLVTAIAGCVVLVVILLEYRNIESGNRLMRGHNFGLKTDRELLNLDGVRFLDGPRDFIYFGFDTATQEMTQQELDWMRRVVERYPRVPAIYRYACALALNGERALGERELKKIKVFYNEELYLYYLNFFNQSVELGFELKSGVQKSSVSD